MEINKEYYDAQIKYINEIRSIRHDIQAHMIVLQYYLEAGDYDKAKEYLVDMKKQQNLHRIVVKDTGNDLVNAIVSDILSRSSEEIIFEMKGVLPEKMEMSEYDICILFSNIFSNAKEACEKLKFSKPIIRMEVEDTKEKLYILVQNPIEWKIDLQDGSFVSTKQNKEEHGFGTKNIIQTIKKYQGKIDFFITDEIFQVVINFKK